MEASKFLKDQVEAVKLAQEVKEDYKCFALNVANVWHATQMDFNVKQLIKDARLIEAYIKESN